MAKRVTEEIAMQMLREYTARRAKSDRVKPPMIRRAGKYVVAAHSVRGRGVAEIVSLSDVIRWCQDAVVAFERDREWSDAIEAMEDCDKPSDVADEG